MTIDELFDEFERGLFTDTEFSAHLLLVLGKTSGSSWLRRLPMRLRADVALLAQEIVSGADITYVGGEQQFRIPIEGARAALIALSTE